MHEQNQSEQNLSAKLEAFWQKMMAGSSVEAEAQKILDRVYSHWVDAALDVVSAADISRSRDVVVYHSSTEAGVYGPSKPEGMTSLLNYMKPGQGS